MKTASGFDIGGTFHFEQVRDGKVIDRWDADNLVVNQGLNHLLNVELQGATQVTAWYLGVFEGNYTPVAGDTAATFPASATESTAYNEATRQAWSPVASTAQSITNSASVATFTVNATKTFYGAFLVSASAKNATTGTLFAAARFAASRSAISGDLLKVTYTVNASAS